MQIIVGGRQSGKTTALKEWILEALVAYEDPDDEVRIGVVLTGDGRDRLLEEIRVESRMLVPDHLVITYRHNDTYGIRGRNNFRFGLDDFNHVPLHVAKTAIDGLAPMGIGLVTINTDHEGEGVDVLGTTIRVLNRTGSDCDYGDFPMNVGESLTPSGPTG